MSDVSRRRRTRLVALGAAAVTGAGGIALVAPGMAHAAQSLIIPSSASVITTANYNHYDLWVTDTNTAWAGDYKVKVTPVTGAAPTVQVQVKGAAAGAAPGAGATNQAAANGVYDLLSAAATDLNPALQNVRVIADAAAASSFKVQVFKDSNGDNLLDASVDAVSNETTVTGISKEDVVIVPTVPSAAAAKGDVITPKATITTTLAYNLNAVALVTFGSVGANVVVHANAASYDATTKVYTGAPQTMTNAGITTVQAKLGVAGTLRVGATSVTATDYQVTAAASEGVKGANQTLLGKIRPGTTTATFKAKITSTRADKSGIPVNIKVTNVDVPATKLTVDGQDASVVASPVTVTRLTDANGEATVQVVDSSALNAETYWVDVNSGGQNAAQIVADYQTAAAGTLTVPSAATGVVAGQVAVEAKVTDQYAQPFSTDVKVLFDNDAGNNTTDNLVAVSAGSATFTYTDTVKNGGDDVLTVNVTDAIGTINAGVTGAGSLTTVKWVTNATPANVAVVASADNSVAALAANDTSRAVDTTGDLKVTDDTEIVRLAATVTNSVGGAVAGTPVTFTGSTGVTFAAEDGDGDADDISEDTSVFSSSLTVNASAAGAAVAYAKVTKTGKATFSAMAGSASKSSEVSIKNLPVNARNITLNPGSTDKEPGDFQTLKAKVTDRFGNGVESVNVTFSETGAGRFASGDNGFVRGTNADGVIELDVTSATEESGTLTATAEITTANTECDDLAGHADINNNGVIDAGEAVTGLAAGDCDNNAKVNFGAPTTITSPTGYASRVVSGATVTIRGTTMANGKVLLYQRLPGGSYTRMRGYSQASSSGSWSWGQKVTQTTYYYARRDGSSSASNSIRVNVGSAARIAAIAKATF